MKKLLIFFLGIFWLTLGQAQNVNANSSDSNYKEDQFYFGVTYNLLGNRPNNMSQNGFSSGFHIGRIWDIPLNERRNVGVGIGLGYSVNSINENLRIGKNDQGNLTYQIIEGGTFGKNKIVLQLVEMPFEFRWRTSTSQDYNFWKIYTGFKLGYVVTSVAKYQGDLSDEKITNLEDINKVQYGFTISAGYDKINVHLYYALNTLFKDNAKLNEESLDFKMVKIGLILYIL